MHTDRVILETLIPSSLVLLLLITGFLLTGILILFYQHVLLKSASLSRDGASVRGFWPGLQSFFHLGVSLVWPCGQFPGVLQL